MEVDLILRGARILTMDPGRPQAQALAILGDRIVAASMTLNGTPIDPAASYRITINNFLAVGGDGFTVTKTPLTNLKLNKFGEIEGYYNPASDTLLYDALLARLKDFGGDGAKAFAQPFYKPKKDGSPGPRVDKVKICEKATVGLPVRDGIAANGREAQQVVQPASIDADRHHFGTFDQGFECQPGELLLLPEVSPGPASGTQVQADLDVEMLGEELLKGAVRLGQVLAQLVFQPFGADRASEVRIGEVEALGPQVVLGLDHVGREFVQDAKRLAVGNLADRKSVV